MVEDSLRHQLPHGLTDLFFEQAAARGKVEGIVEDVYRRWGYRRIILPTFEYDDSLAVGTSPQIKEEMYRFFDREGAVLALRPDMTVPTARVVGTKLYDQPLPLRFYYVGNVFRYEELQAGRRREFTQAGIELIGADTPEADAEVLAVTISTLRALGIERMQINLGQVAYLKAILSDAPLSNGDLTRLEQVIGRKNDVELARTLGDLGISGDTARAVRAMPQLCGDEGALQEARKLSTNDEATRALDRLQRVYDLLRIEGMADLIILDLGEVRSMAYYTGITFHGYVEGLGYHVCRGGRYDNLISNFGHDIPAVGFALGLERTMLVTHTQVDIAPDLLMQSCDHAACRALAAQARERGLAVIVDVSGRRGSELVAYGRTRFAHRIAYCLDASTYLLVEGETSRKLNLDEFEEEIRSWSN